MLDGQFLCVWNKWHSNVVWSYSLFANQHTLGSMITMISGRSGLGGKLIWEESMCLKLYAPSERARSRSQCH